MYPKWLKIPQAPENTEFLNVTSGMLIEINIQDIWLNKTIHIESVILNTTAIC